MKNFKIKAIIFIIIMTTGAVNAFSHCDSMEGPVIKDAKQAFENNNINYVLKWVSKQNEKEIKEAFELSSKVRILNSDAKNLAEKYFFETLVRIHRSGEGIPFTGVKPYGFPIDEKILAADKAIESKDISGLLSIVPKKKHKELQKKFNEVLALSDYSINDVEASRKWVEAYVQFFHFAEGEVIEHKQQGHH